MFGSRTAWLCLGVSCVTRSPPGGPGPTNGLPSKHGGDGTAPNDFRRPCLSEQRLSFFFWCGGEGARTEASVFDSPRLSMFGGVLGFPPHF